jgi:hypothetical protein
VNQEITMHIHMLTLAAALALIAGCDQGSERRAATPPSQSGSGASSGASTPTTPANIGQPGSLEEKKEGANPVQGQVDPKQPEQHRDFQQRGDGKGPTSPETQPKTGG